MLEPSRKDTTRAKTDRVRKVENKRKIECVVDYFHGTKARCLARVANRLLPIDLPRHALTAHQLGPNMWFEWTGSKEQADTVSPEDIVLILSPDQRARESDSGRNC